MSDAHELEREARRQALAACLASAWLLCAALLGVESFLVYFGPALVMVVLAILQRFPGERALASVLERRRHAPRRRAAPARRCESSPFTRLRRGGTLLGWSLAGRAPPRSLLV